MSRLFLPPVNRAMHVLDRNFFQKHIPTSAARIFEFRDIGRVRKECAADLLQVKRVELMPSDPGRQGRKLLLLRPEVKHDDLTTACEATQELVKKKVMEVVPYTIHMHYEHWSYNQLLAAVLPVDCHEDIPGAFTLAGHLAHLNLRSRFLPYRHLIAQLILDKNPPVKTVVNKIEDVGASSIFRTFPMEVLAGPADTVVEVKESNCTFVFDFAKVYWNTRLGHEHERIVSKFKPHEAVCDVMAGVGPFALPAAKKEVFVWANDLNPESYASLRDNVTRNKVDAFVRVYNADGREFIRSSIADLYKLHKSSASKFITVPGTPVKFSRTKARQGIPQEKPKERKIEQPLAFAHFVMNLPASAVEFLDAFIGSYRDLEAAYDRGEFRMPMIHVSTFHRECPDRGEEFAEEDVCASISSHLRHSVGRDQVEVHFVRRVAPSKSMYCASFRLPEDVAFAEIPKVVVDEEKVERERKERLWKKWSTVD